MILIPQSRNSHKNTKNEQKRHAREWMRAYLFYSVDFGLIFHDKIHEFNGDFL